MKEEEVDYDDDGGGGSTTTTTTTISSSTTTATTAAATSGAVGSLDVRSKQNNGCRPTEIQNLTKSHYLLNLLLFVSII
jgi:hypothetical protein